MRILLAWLINTVAVMITAHLLPGVAVRNFFSALIAALVLGLANAVLRPVLIILTLPLTLLSLGLFILVINALLVLLTSAIVPGFEVHSFWWALLFSLILSIVSFILHRIIPE